MNKHQVGKFRKFRYNRRYEILLLSILILIFGDVFFPAEFDPMPFLIFQNVLASTILFYGQKKWRIPLFTLLFLLIALVLINQFTEITHSRIIFSFMYIVYFVFLSAEVYRQIIIAKYVDFGMLAAVLCGFIILGLIGGSVFSIIEFTHHDSFNNLSQGVGGFSDLIYFSYITIISVGYGDITPATEIAKKASVFFGLVGYLYGVVVIGIIIGKYISKNN